MMKLAEFHANAATEKPPKRPSINNAEEPAFFLERTEIDRVCFGRSETHGWGSFREKKYSRRRNGKKSHLNILSSVVSSVEM
ncbi:unnamed protein product [Brassica oleracea var. botrytis]